MPEPAAVDPVPDTGNALAPDGPWERRRAVLAATDRGAAVTVRGVRGREPALVVRTCRRCGGVRVRWAGRVRTVSLAGKPGPAHHPRLLPAARRRGTVRLTATSSRRVAVRALLVRR